MKQLYSLILLLILLIPKSTNAQCFECIISYGNWSNDNISGLEITNNGFVVTSSDPDNNYLRYYDKNCRIIWKKKYGNGYSLSEFPSALKLDNQENIYVNETLSFSGYDSKNITKFDKTGNQLWEIIYSNRYGNDPINRVWYADLVDYKILKNKLYIIGSFREALILNGKIIYDFRDAYPYFVENYFISTYNLDGEYLSTKLLSTNRNNTKYHSAVIDDQENLYLAKTQNVPLENTNQTVIEKYDNELNLQYEKIISQSNQLENISNIQPIKLFYSSKYKTISLFSIFFNKTKIENEIITSGNDINYPNHLLNYIDINDGKPLKYINFNYIPRNNDFSVLDNYIDILETPNKDYLITKFNRKITINNQTIIPKLSEQYEYTSTDKNPNYDTNIILFEVNQNTLNLNPILSTNHGPKEKYLRRDSPRLIKYIDNENLLISGLFQSSNFEINNVHIPNKSGNGDTDYFIYKYNLNNKPNNISIKINNSCFGEKTNFTIDGDFDSVTWDFGDGNSSTDKTPKHTYTNPGKYIVKTIVTCKGEKREFTNEVNIKSALKLEKLNDIIVCENNSNEGIGTFDTSNISTILVKNQTNYSIKFYDENENEINDFVSKIYKNKTPFQEKITVKGYFNENPNCVSETSFLLKTSTKSDLPITKDNLNYCINENKIFKNILIDGINLIFYDSNGTVINPNEKIVTGRYFVTQKENTKCESNKLELNINIQNTNPPLAENLQSFCSINKPTLNSIEIKGENIIWYESETSTIPLDKNTLLENNKIYFATQKILDCESQNRTNVKIKLTNYTLLNSTPFQICKDETTIGKFNLADKTSEIATLLNVTSNNVLYYENLKNAQNNINPISGNFNNINNLDKIYATSFSNDACKTFVEIPLIENINPTIDIKNEYSKCKDNSVEITLNQDYNEILWSTGEKNKKSIQITLPGKYTVTVKNDFCSTTKEFEVENYDDLKIDYIYNGQIVTFTLFNDLSTQFSLDGVNYNSNPSFYLNPGEYTFYFKSTNGCIEIRKIYLLKDLPGLLTPNGDGKNDYWNLSYIKDLKYVRVFNRFGRTVFEANKENQPIKWNGKYQSNLLPSDTYWYIIELENGKKINGSLLIKND